TRPGSLSAGGGHAGPVAVMTHDPRTPGSPGADRHPPQMAVWTGEFGKEYTDRNLLSPSQLDALYVERFGVTRRAMNEEFLQPLDRQARVLEVGSNVGNQLVLLQVMGFTQ